MLQRILQTKKKMDVLPIIGVWENEGSWIELQQRQGISFLLTVHTDVLFNRNRGLCLEGEVSGRDVKTTSDLI